MSDPQISMERVVYIDRNAEEVWARMHNIRELLSLFPYAKLVDTQSESTGTVSIRNAPYKYSITKNSLRLKGRTAVGINVTPVGENLTKVHFAAVDRSGTYIPVIGSAADIFFANLRKATEVPPVKEKEEVTEQKREERTETRTASRQTVDGKEQRSDKKAKSAPAKKRSAREKKSGGLTKRGIFAIAALILLLIVSILIVFKPFGGKSGGKPVEKVSVDLKKAVKLELGMAPAQIENILGVKGKAQGGMTVYGNQDAVAVTFNNGGAQRIVIRDQSSAITPMSKADSIEKVEIPEDTQIDFASMEELFGYPVSEIELLYNEFGEETVKLHFGYIDPLANFDPNWRGEDVAEITPQGVETYRWYRESEMRGLLCGDKSGAPASHYTFFSDYLQDFYAYCSSMALLNNYSRGDIEVVLGGKLTKYASYAALEMYDLVLDDPIAMYTKDGETIPAYKITVSLNNGYFVNAMYCNMRFANDSSIKLNTYGVARGLTMADIQEKIQRLPTAMLYDTSSVYLCWGAMREGNTIDEQFELVVRFDLETGLSANVYNNTSLVSQAGVNVPAQEESSS